MAEERDFEHEVEFWSSMAADAALEERALRRVERAARSLLKNHPNFRYSLDFMPMEAALGELALLDAIRFHRKAPPIPKAPT